MVKIIENWDSVKVWIKKEQQKLITFIHNLEFDLIEWLFSDLSTLNTMILIYRQIWIMDF